MILLITTLISSNSNGLRLLHIHNMRICLLRPKFDRIHHSPTELLKYIYIAWIRYPPKKLPRLTDLESVNNTIRYIISNMNNSKFNKSPSMLSSPFRVHIDPNAENHMIIKCQLTLCIELELFRCISLGNIDFHSRFSSC